MPASERRKGPCTPYTHPHPPALPFKAVAFLIWSKFGVIKFNSSSSPPPFWNLVIHKTILNYQLMALLFWEQNQQFRCIHFYSKCALHWKDQDLYTCNLAFTLYCLKLFSVLTVLSMQGVSLLLSLHLKFAPHNGS